MKPILFAAVILVAILDASGASASPAPAPEAPNPAFPRPEEYPRADGWTPGAPSPDWPHVVAGEVPGSWMPEPGWKFANDASGDFAVEPLPAQPAILVELTGKTISLPAPEGFWTPEPGTPLAGMFAEEDALDRGNRMLGHWCAVDADSGCLFVAAVKQIRSLEGRFVTRIDFTLLKSQWKEMLQENTEDIVGAVNEGLARADGGTPLRKSETHMPAVAVAGLRALPPHREDDDRLCITMVRTETEETGDGTLVRYFVNSGALLLLQGRVLNLYLGMFVDSPEEIDAAVAETRTRLGNWLGGIDAICSTANAAFSTGDSSGVRDIPLRTNDSPSPGHPILLQILLYAAAGGVVGAISGIFRRRK